MSYSWKSDEEVEAARAAVEERDVRRPGLALQRADGVDADALVAHEDVADAEDEDRPRRATGRPPLTASPPASR